MKNSLPTIIEQLHSSSEENEDTDEEKTISLLIEVPENLFFFEGHFKDFPVIPGYILVAWASELSKEYFQLDYEKFNISASKFQSPIDPNKKLQFRLKYFPKNNKLDFSYSDYNEGKDITGGSLQNKTYAHGSLLFHS